MRHSRWLFALLVTLVAVTMGASTFGSSAARADSTVEICGVIPTTLTIMDNARLVCDVQCLQSDNQMCINFGRPGIKLMLNGFRMTGMANSPPRTNCVSTAEFGALQADGIHSKFDRVKIEGPGIVQNMKRHGIALFGAAPDFVEDSWISKVVSHQNCFSGIWLLRVNDSNVHHVVSVKNSAASSFFPCGGLCITNSSRNHVWESTFAGNGSIAVGGPPAAIPNDFGAGLVGDSDGNKIERNVIGGNINGLALFPLAAGVSPELNLIWRNVIVGNPPIEISADNPAIDPVGADIRDFSIPNSNDFRENTCLTYTGGHTPAPCPNVSPSDEMP